MDLYLSVRKKDETVITTHVTNNVYDIQMYNFWNDHIMQYIKLYKNNILYKSVNNNWLL
jgi:mRNA degradation ribonuclease J1/J2